MIKSRGPASLQARSVVAALTTAALLAPTLVACGAFDSGKKSKKSETDENADGDGLTTKLLLSAGGLSTLDGASLLAGKVLPLGTADEEMGYPGIGINYGDVVLEGFKINLRKISMGGIPGAPSASPEATLVDFGTDGKELQIADGFQGTIEVDTDLSLPNGVYRSLTLSFENQMQIKAWAYLDSDNNGAIDTTIWTTANGIAKSATKITSTSGMSGYNYYAYPWAMPLVASSLTDNSTSNTNVLTQFRDPVEVKDSKIITNNKESDTLDLDVLIDTYNIIKVWDGRYGNSNPEAIVMGTPTTNGQGELRLPPPVMPFPQGEQDSRTGCCGLTMNQFFPAGEPHFAMSNYLNAFGLVNQGGLKAHIYLVGKEATFTPFNTQSMTVIFNGDGEPLFARMGIGELNTTLHIGPVAKLFEAATDDSTTYTFATSGGTKDSAGNEDGGLYYGDSVSQAGHTFSGFRSTIIDQKYNMTMKDGPRCKAEYDYCVKESAGVAAYVQRVR